MGYEKVASAVFTQPPMGTCGLTEEAAIKKYPNLDVYLDGDGGGFQAEYFEFTESKEEMLIKVLVNTDDDKVVGMHIVSKDAGEIVCIPGIDQMPARRKYRGGELQKE